MARFGDYLREYAKYVKPGDGRRVIGIYLAWRGRSMEAPGWISWVSFWGRSAAARKVGRGEINDHIDRLLETTIEGRGDMAAGRHPYAFVIGHSFGARVLETAVIGSRPTQVSGACRTLAAGTQAVKAPADVVLFENAATSAGYVRRQLLGECQPCRDTKAGCKDLAAKPNFVESKMTRQPDFQKSHCAEKPSDRRCQPYTLFMSISSSKDWLTRGLLLVAALQHPATFFRRFQTHRVEPADISSTIDPGNDEVFLFQTPPDRPHGKQPAVYMVKRKNTSDISAVNPVWILEVGKEISASHGDVWNKTMLNMLVNLAASDGDMHEPTFVPQAVGPGARRPLKGTVVLQPQ